MAENGNGNGGDGNGGEKGWKELLPEDIRNHPSLENLEGVNDLAKSWVNAQKLIGKEKLPVPSGPEDKETWNLVFSRLGRPEKAETYSIDATAVPEEIPVDDNFLANFKGKAFELGLLPSQVQGLFNWWVETEKGIFGEIVRMEGEDKEKAETVLRQKWGKAYDQNTKLAASVFSKFAGDHAMEFNAKYGNDPIVVEILAAIGKTMSEDNLLGEPAGLTMTPEEAQKEIDKIMGDTTHPYHKGDHPEHKAAVEYVQGLYKMVYPERTK